MPILLLLLAFWVQDDPHAAHMAVGYVPREVLEKPVTLKTNIGKVNEPVSTKSPEAQAFYNQGVAYLHSYVWVEAGRSFQQAMRLDPNLAMAWVGLSRVYSGLDDPAAAKAAIAKAQALSAHTNAWEKTRIAVRAKQLEALAELGNAARHQEYKRTLDEAIAQYIDDVELWLLRGNAEEPTAGGRGQRGSIGSTAFYQEVLRRSPNHFAAHHYLIHSYENLNRMPEALFHGEAYVGLSSAIPHAHHMYGHDLRRVGRIEDAIQRFQKADDLERAYYAAEGIPAHVDWHHAHNLDLLSTSYQYQGQIRQAEKLMREAWSIPAVSEYAYFNKKEFPGFLLARNRPDEALEAGAEMTRGKWVLGRAAGHIMRGHAFLAKSKMTEAREELAAAEKELNDAKGFTSAGQMRSSAQPYLEGLRGVILLRSGQKEEAGAILKEFQRRVRAIPGPDAWSQALFHLEAIARMAREAGDWDLAEYTALQMKEHDASYAGTHYALGLVAERKGDTAQAREHFTQARKFWGKADADLWELSELRKK